MIGQKKSRLGKELLSLMCKRLAFAIRTVSVSLDLDSELRLSILRKCHYAKTAYEASARFVKANRMRSYMSQKIRR